MSTEFKKVFDLFEDELYYLFLRINKVKIAPKKYNFKLEVIFYSNSNEEDKLVPTLVDMKQTKIIFKDILYKIRKEKIEYVDTLFERLEKDIDKKLLEKWDDVEDYFYFIVDLKEMKIYKSKSCNEFKIKYALENIITDIDNALIGTTITEAFMNIGRLITPMPGSKIEKPDNVILPFDLKGKK